MNFSYCLYYLGITGVVTNKMGQEGAAVICNAIIGCSLLPCTELLLLNPPLAHELPAIYCKDATPFFPGYMQL